MKFTDGNWLVRQGVRVKYPAEAYEIEAGSGQLTVLAPTRPIRHRGDTLDGAVLTVRLSSPMPDVLRVRLSHWEGGGDPGPHFEVAPDTNDGVVAEADESEGRLISGRLSARVRRGGEWGIDFEAEGRSLTRSPARGMGYAQVEGEGAYLHEQLALGVGELVYGLGERFTAFAKNGQVVDLWNRDGGTGSDQAYKNVPFYLTNRGYGVFVSHPERVSFEVASEKVSRVQFSVPGESLDYYVIYGPTPAEVLKKYTALTGRPALPPAWSFGLWLTTSFTTSYDEGTVTGILEEMKRRELPLHVFHFDCFWMREFQWCDFRWDPRAFRDPAAMLARLRERGLRVCVWVNPYIAQRSRLFDEGKRCGYLLRKPNGGVWQTDQWQPGMGIVDFTNPDARRWYAGALKGLLDAGVDCFKTDFGERIPTNVAWWDGSSPEGMHNYYSYLYNQTVFEVLEEVRGKGEAAVFARSATAGGQRFPVHWGGDCYSSFESMAESLRGGLSLGLSGFGFWSHDIGGFEGMPPAEVYKRWIAFGLLSSHSRLHGSSSYRVPWLFDEEAVDTLRFFTNLKCRLMPYLYGAAVEATQRGVPVMRPMLLEFPGDPACETLDRQYLLGGSLLVAPVFSADGVVTYYVPEGRWTHHLSGEVVNGPCWRQETHGFLSLPLLVRPGTILPMGSRDDVPDYEFGHGVALEAYELEDGRTAQVTVPTLSGEPDRVFRVTRSGCTVVAEVEEAAGGVPERPWSLLLVGCHATTQVEGGSAEDTDRGVRVRADAGARRLRVEC